MCTDACDTSILSCSMPSEMTDRRTDSNTVSVSVTNSLTAVDMELLSWEMVVGVCMEGVPSAEDRRVLVELRAGVFIGVFPNTEEVARMVGVTVTVVEANSGAVVEAGELVEQVNREFPMTESFATMVGVSLVVELSTGWKAREEEQERRAKGEFPITESVTRMQGVLRLDVESR